MDKEEKKENRWAWLPAVMPGLAKLMKDRRKEHGAAFINECWTRGMAGEPGWFFAREGVVAIGTPWPAVVDLMLQHPQLPKNTHEHVLLCLREVDHGAK